MKMRVSAIFLYFFSFLWLVFATLWFLRNSPYRLLYGTMGVVYAFSLFVAAYFLTKKFWAWWLAIIFIGGSILIFLFDQIGIIDIAYIVLATMLFILLFRNRPVIGNH